MDEKFLHFLWKYHVEVQKEYKTVLGEKLVIIHKGFENTDSGPDFFNVKIKIGNVTWAGNVEIHINTSDWDKHCHHKDRAYNNVILHVVSKNDGQAYDAKGRLLPCLLLDNAERYYTMYKDTYAKKYFVPCESHLHIIPEVVRNFWLPKLAIERIEDQYIKIREKLAYNKNSWEETFYQMLARNFGLKINVEPFEQLARKTPVSILSKHKNNLLQIEALLFGQAGFLEENMKKDTYYIELQREYVFLKKKYKLTPIKKSQWKFMRLRPYNFPTIRIAQLARLIYQSSSMFSRVLESTSIGYLKKMMEVEASLYWDTHYTFEKESSKTIPKKVGKTMQNLLLINVFIPVLFIYGDYYDKQYLKDRALDYLDNMEPENNSTIKKWKSYGISAKCALYSQALIQLKNKYCNFTSCINCEFGNIILKKEYEKRYP